MKVVMLSILTLAFAACATSNAVGPNGLPTNNTASFQVKSDLAAQLGGEYIGLQFDGTVIECAVILDLSMARSVASARARATLAFAGENVVVHKTIQNLPGGGKLMQIFKSVTASGIIIPEIRCAKTSHMRQVCCAKAQTAKL